MLLRGDQLAAHLERELGSIYAVYGDELLSLEAADAIRARVRRAGFDERQTQVVTSGFNWDDLLAAAANLSLFGSRKLIDLRLPSGKPGVAGAKALQRYAELAPSDTVLLISLPDLSWQDEKAAWLAKLAESGVVVKAVAPSLAELPGWLAMRLKRQLQEAEPAALRFIAERVEGNLLAAHQEILKLGLLYPSGRLGLTQVRDAVLNVARYDLDGLREALLAGDLGRYARTLDGLHQEGEAPPLVLWAVSEEVRALFQVRSGLAGGKGLDLLLKEAKVWGPRQTGFRKAVPRASPARLKASLKHLARIDRMIKGVLAGDPWTELLRVGVRLAG